MSLIHWWPLNGNLKDYGLSNKDLANSNTTSDNSGKIGKCYSFNGSSSYLRTQTNVNSISSHFSVSFWVRLNNNSSNQTFLSSRTSTGFGFSIFYIGNAGIRFDNGSNSSDSQWQSSTTISTSAWAHICVVQDSTKRYIYKNGVLDSSTTVSAISGNTAQYLLIGASSSADSTPTGNYLSGKLNDVRIYDHALSKKEVKEISKGLVLHYTFEDAYAEGTTNYGIMNNNINVISGLENDWKAEKLDRYTLKVTALKNNPSYSTYGNIVGSLCGTVSVSAGNPCTLSCEIVDYKGSLSRIYPCSGGFGSIVGYGTYNGRVYRTITHTSNWTHDICIRTSSQSNIVAGDYLVIRFTQIELKDHATPYVNGTRTNGLIYDSSGYGYNGTQNGSLQILGDSACGEYSANIVNSYIKVPALACPECTILFWIKRNSLTGTRQFIYTGWPGISIELTTSNGWQVYYTRDSSYNTVSIPVNQNLDANVWYHIGIVIGTTGNYSFINGVQKGTSSYLAPYYGTDDFRIGSYGSYVNFNAKIADFKIYSTALSASDILAEYNRKASIDRNGNLFTGEFVEENDRINITKTGVVESSHFEEGTSVVKMVDGYTELEYIESTGTQYIDTNVNVGPNIVSELEWQVTSISNTVSGWSVLYGYASSSSGKPYALWGNNSAIKFYRQSDVQTIALPTTKTTTIVTSNATAIEKHIYVFSIGPDCGSYVNARNPYKLYNLKIYNSGILIRHFIPAKRNKDNVIGMYDTINRAFYTNSGTGAFTAGPEKGNLSIVYSKQIIEN